MPGNAAGLRIEVALGTAQSMGKQDGRSRRASRQVERGIDQHRLAIGFGPAEHELVRDVDRRRAIEQYQPAATDRQECGQGAEHQPTSPRQLSSGHPSPPASIH